MSNPEHPPTDRPAPPPKKAAPLCPYDYPYEYLPDANTMGYRASVMLVAASLLAAILIVAVYLGCGRA